MKKYSGLIFVLMIFLGTGCSPMLRGKIAPANFKTAESWPDFYIKNHQSVTSLQSKARFTIESSDFSTNFVVSLIFAKPDTLFFQAEALLGVDIGKVFVGKDRFIFYNQYENQFVAGSLNDPFQNNFLQTSIGLKQLKLAVLGDVPIPPDLKLVDSAHGIFSALVNGEKWRYVVDLKTGELLKYEIYRNNQVVLREEFDRYRIIDGVLLPGLIRIISPGKREMVSVFHKDIKLNKRVDPGEYKIVIVPKVKQLMLSE